jgi:uncharacterized protein YjcR
MVNQVHAWKPRDGWHNACVDAELDRADWEPSLGAGETRHGQSQEGWARGGRDDREDDPAELGIADLDGMADRCGR